MDSLHHDPMLSAHARPSRLLRRQIRKENNTSPRRDTLHPRLGSHHRSQVRGHPLRGPHVLGAGLWHRVHRRANVHGGNRHKRSPRRSLHSHHVNE